MRATSHTKDVRQKIVNASARDRTYHIPSQCTAVHPIKSHLFGGIVAVVPVPVRSVETIPFS